MMSNAIQGQDGTTSSETQLWCVYPGGEGAGAGKHIVLIAGDDEYRSEEALPMLGKILSVHHGFKCTVLFPINPEDNTIKPDHQTNIPGMEAIDSADLLIIGLRFRKLPNESMKHFADYVDAGKPIIGLRTSTHAFNFPGKGESDYKHYSFNSSKWPGGFGRQVLGDTWINHHGHHGRQSTRGVASPDNASHPILKGVFDVWGPTDVYGIRHLTKDADILMYGAVLKGMNPEDPMILTKKNSPMMPLIWTKKYASSSGVDAKIVCTTMGSSTDFQSEDLRRVVINSAYWCTGMESKIPENANVDFVDPYEPTNFGFGSYQKGLKPADFNLK